MIARLTILVAAISLIWLPSPSAGQEFRIESMSGPELCTMEQMIKGHKIAFPGVTLADLRSQLSLRSEKCKPRDFYVQAANALVADAKMLAAGSPPLTLDRDPFPSKSESEQFRELRSMSAPEVCTIRAFVTKSGVSLNGITGSTASTVLMERAEPCNPASFYQSIAGGLITQLRQASDKRGSDNNNVASTAENIVGAILKGYLAHKYGSSAIEPYNSSRDEGCKSDFDCGSGNSCVKAPFKSTGTCLKKVDEYGLPTLNGPDADSLMTPIEGQCDFDLDCPITFKCHKTLKVCVK